MGESPLFFLERVMKILLKILCLFISFVAGWFLVTGILPDFPKLSNEVLVLSGFVGVAIYSPLIKQVF